MNEWNRWDTRPEYGTVVEIQLSGVICTGIYLDDGIDGIIEFDDHDMEIDENPDSEWRFPQK